MRKGEMTKLRYTILIELHQTGKVRLTTKLPSGIPADGSGLVAIPLSISPQPLRVPMAEQGHLTDPGLPGLPASGDAPSLSRQLPLRATIPNRN